MKYLEKLTDNISLFSSFIYLGGAITILFDLLRFDIEKATNFELLIYTNGFVIATLMLLISLQFWIYSKLKEVEKNE